MNPTDGEFINAYDLYTLTSLQIKDAETLQFYIYTKGWVEAIKADIPWTKIYVEGYFPAKLLRIKNLVYENGGFSSNIHKTAYTFGADFESAFGKAGITNFKANELGFKEGETLDSIYFEHEAIDPDFKSIGGIGGHSIFILKPDLFSFCEKHGVFDIEERYNSFVSNQLLNPEHDTPPSSASSAHEPIFHSNTSQTLLDLVEANNYFWENYDPSDPAETAPTKEQVTEWFINRGYSPSLSGSMDTVLRDGRNKPGGRPEKA